MQAVVCCRYWAAATRPDLGYIGFIQGCRLWFIVMWRFGELHQVRLLQVCSHGHITDPELVTDLDV